MEKISLTKRELKGWGDLVWVPVGIVGVLMVLFIVVAIRHSAADWYYMKQFKRLVICPGSGISRRRDGEVIEDWSLFTQEGITQSLKPYAAEAIALASLLRKHAREIQSTPAEETLKTALTDLKESGATFAPAAGEQPPAEPGTASSPFDDPPASRP